MKKVFKTMAFTLLGLVLSVNLGWAADVTYKLEAVTSVTAGEKYVFEQSNHVAIGSVSSSALQTTATYATTSLKGNENYVWTLETATGGFYIKNVALTSNQYLNNASKTNVSLSTASSVWTFDFKNGVALISNTSNSDRFLGYTTATSYVYKAYATGNLGDYPHAITVYKLVEEGDTPTDPVDPTVTFSNGTVKATKTIDLSTLYDSDSDGAVSYSIEEGGSFATLAGTILTGNAEGTVKVKAVQAATSSYNAAEATATITVTAAPVEVVYSLVTDASKLEEGQKIIIVNSGADKALSSTQNSNNRSAVTVTCVDNKISVEEGSGVQVITLGKAQKDSKNYWTLGVDDGYLYAASSSSNYLKTQATLNDNGKWDISISDNIASITAQGTNTRNQLKNNGDIFSCYGSGQTAVKIFAASIPPTNEAVTFAAPTDGTLVIKNGATPISSGAIIQNGTVLDVTFGMTPAEAYKDVAIKVTKTDGGDDVTSTVYDATEQQITMPRYPITVAVTFTKLYKITLATDGEGTGTATMNGVTTDIYVDGETQIDLVASAVAPNEFTKWSATDNIAIDKENEAETYAFASGDGTITATFGVSALLPLDAPTLSAPTNITYNSVTLNWQELANAEGGYNVEIWLDDVRVVFESGIGETSWTPDFTFQANTTYTYTVQGVGDGTTYAEENNPKAQSTVTTADYPAVVLTLSENGTPSTKDGKLKTPIELPTTSTEACEGKVFVGWSENPIEGEVGKDQVSLLDATYTFTDPAVLEKTIYAVYAKMVEGDKYFEKVSSAPSDWCGKYLIVYETGKLAMNGSLETLDAVGNSKSVTISNNKIDWSTDMEAITFTVAYKTGSSTVYSLKSASGKYISGTTTSAAASNGIKQADTDANYEISFNGLTIESKSSDQQMVLKYNKASDQTRFRFYKSGQEAIALYKYSATLDYSNYCTTCALAPVTATVLANPATAGSVSAKDEDGNPVTSETELNPTDIITVTAEETNDNYYFYNWTLASGDDAEIDDATKATTDVKMGEKDATITANFFPWVNLSVSPTSKDLELPLASAEGSFEITVTSSQNVTFADNLEATIATGDGEKATILARITSSTANSATYEVQYEFTAADDYVATIEFTGIDSRGKDANSATLTINAIVKDLETLDAPEVTADKTAKSVTLTWADVEHAQGYTVAWNGGEAESATSGWTKEGLTAGTEYTYVVTAVGDGITYLSNYTEGSVTTTAKKVTGIKDPVFVKEGGKYLVGETLSKNDFKVTKVYNDDTEESGEAVTYAYVDNKDEEAYVFTEADATAGSKTIKLKFSTYEITIDVTVESFPKYTVKFSVPSCITPVADAKVNQGSALDLTSIVAGDPQYLEGYSFAGWSKESIAEGSASGKLITSYTPTEDNTTLYAVYKYDKQQGTAGWVKEDLANLSATDVFVITGTNSTATYSMSNNNGTQSAPTATAVTISNNKITSTISDNQKWNVSGNATDGYVFYPNGVTDKYLYATNKNNGVRVGKGDAKAMTITNGYLTIPTTETRYIGVYDGADWRCYTSYTGSSNIKDQTFAYYKYQAGGDTYKYTSTIDCSEPHTVSVPQAVTGGTVSASPTSAKAGATITVTYAPADNYTVGTLTWTAEGGEPNDLEPIYGTTEYTFTMPDANVTIAATFEEIEYVTINWVIDDAVPQSTQVVKGAQVVPPTVTETCEENIKFMGWTASETITSKPADLFNTADAPIAETEATYYSVYAQEDEGTQPAAEAFYTATFTKLTSGDNFQSYASAHEFTSGTITWSVTGNQGLTIDAVRIGGSHTTDQNRVTQTTDKIGSKIAKVVINHAGKSKDAFVLNSITLDVASDADFVNILATKILTPSVSTSTAGTIEFTPETGTVWAKDSYYRFTVNCKTGGSNCGLDVASIAFYPNGGTEYSAYSTSCPPAYTLTYAGIGGYGTSCDLSTKHTCDESITACTPDAREGYTFKGWTRSDGATTIAAGEEFNMPCNDLTLTATWDSLVTFHVQGTIDKTQTIDADKHVTGYTPTATCTGKQFMGWSATNIEGLQDDAPADLFTNFTDKEFAAPTNLYAVYASINGGKITGEAIHNDNVSSYVFSTDVKTCPMQYATYTLDENTMFASAQISNIYYAGFKLDASELDAHFTTSKIKDLDSLSFEYITNGAAISYYVMISADGEEWTKVSKDDAALKTTGVNTITVRKFTQGDYYVKVGVTYKSATPKYYAVITKMSYTCATCSYWYSDYSTSCTMAASATISYNDKYTYAASSVGETMTISNDSHVATGYQLYSLTINGTTYNVGDSYILAHDVTPEAADIRPIMTWTERYSASELWNTTTAPNENGKLVLPTTQPASFAPGLYEFDGWTAEVFSTETKTVAPTYVSAETDAPATPTTYYAVYKKANAGGTGYIYRQTTPSPLYQLTYSPNGGDGTDYITYTDLSTATTPASSLFTRGGATLVGWTLNPNAETIEYVGTSTQITNINGDRHYYAVWIGSLQMSSAIALTSAPGATVGSATFTLSSTDLGTITTLRFAYYDVDNNIWYRTDNRKNSEFRLCNTDYLLTNAENNVTIDQPIDFSKEYAIVYTPNSGNKMSHYKLVVELLNNSKVMATQEFDLLGRALPDKFVIATQKGDQWYALQANMTSSQEWAGVPIDVEDGLAFASDTLLYNLKTYNHDKSHVLFQSAYMQGHLRAASDDGTGIRNDATTISSQNDPYAWILNLTDSTNFTTYTMGNVNNNRTLAMNGTNFGMYASYSTNTIYFLPLGTPNTIMIESNSTLDNYGNLSHTNLVITTGATLTIEQDVTIYDIDIQPGATLNLTDGTLSMHQLSLHGGWTEGDNSHFDVPGLYIASDATLQRQEQIIYYYLTVDFDMYYPFALPFESNLNTLRYVSKPETDYSSQIRSDGAIRISEYDGEARGTGVIPEGTSTRFWKYLSSTDKIVPGRGYMISAKKLKNETKAFLRFAMTVPNEWMASGERGSITMGDVTTTKNQVFVGAWGVGTAAWYNQGWNYIANPYMAKISSNDNNISSMLQATNGNVRYATIPDYTIDDYNQVPMTEAVLQPFSPFFVQIATTGDLTFQSSSRQAVPAYLAAITEPLVEQEAYIRIQGHEQSDLLGLLISNHYSDAYDINADLTKELGTANTLRAYMIHAGTNMAYLAVDEQTAATFIPIDVRIPADGDYTFSLADFSELSATEGIYLMDYQTNTLTNLEETDYSFTATAGMLSGRFSINAVIQQPQTPTDTENIDSEGDSCSKKIINNGHFYIIHHSDIYDGQGKRVKINSVSTNN